MRPPFRFGVECEGPNAGLPTLVLMSAEYHRLSVVHDQSEARGIEPAHLWLERQPYEAFDWPAVRQILRAGYRVTVLLLCDGDVPPRDIATHSGTSLVWRVPEGFKACASHASYMTISEGAFAGTQVCLDERSALTPDLYGKDDVWY